MIELKNFHIGRAIRNRFDELELTKTEFGHRIGDMEENKGELKSQLCDKDELINVYKNK